MKLEIFCCSIFNGRHAYDTSRNNIPTSLGNKRRLDFDEHLFENANEIHSSITESFTLRSSFKPGYCKWVEI
jgi:hypothetical protein